MVSVGFRIIIGGLKKKCLLAHIAAPRFLKELFTVATVELH
jgi:hypothetical protein